MDAYIHDNFTKHGYIIKGLPVKIGHSVIQVLKGDVEVLFMHSIILPSSIEISQITRRGYNKNNTRRNNSTKGLGKKIIIVLAMEAYRLRIDTMKCLAVPHSSGQDATSLFKYYTTLGFGGNYVIEYNETTGHATKQFELTVRDFLLKHNINLRDILQVPESEEEQEFVYESENENTSNGGGRTRYSRKSLLRPYRKNRKSTRRQKIQRYKYIKGI